MKNQLQLFSYAALSSYANQEFFIVDAGEGEFPIYQQKSGQKPVPIAYLRYQLMLLRPLMTSNQFDYILMNLPMYASFSDGMKRIEAYRENNSVHIGKNISELLNN